MERIVVSVFVVFFALSLLVGSADILSMMIHVPIGTGILGLVIIALLVASSTPTTKPPSKPTPPRDWQA